MIAEDHLLEKIVKEKKDFKKLLDNHYELEGKIQNFEKRRHLTPEEEIEMKKLKKIKLKEKDIMMDVVNEYRAKEA